MKAQGEAEALRAEHDLEMLKSTLKNSAPAPQHQKPRSAGQQARDDFMQLREYFDEIKKAFIECCGGENKMSQQDYELLEDIDLSLRNKIRERIEGL